MDWAFAINNVVLPLAGMATGIIIIKTVATMVRAASASEAKVAAGGVRDELEQIHARIEHLEGQAERVEEIAERVDFAERMLARGRGADGIIAENPDA